MMNNKKNVPDIRFKGFNFGWKSKRFDKTFSMLCNNTLSRADLNYEKGSTKNVHYGDILIRFGECTNVARENIPYISDDKVADKYISSRLQDGDIVFADTAEDATAGKCSEFFNIQEQSIISGLHTIPCHPLFPFSIGYLGYFLNSPSYHNQLLPLMQGTKVVGISKTAIKETNISFPEDVDEQKAIGNYFQNIDRLINTSQTKLDKLKNIKKACLEKMFPRNGSTTPELRFKGFSEEWKETVIGKFCSITIGEFVIQTKQRNDAPYPVYNGGISYTGFYDEYNNEGCKIIISARGANAGFVNKSEFKYWAGNSCYSVGVLDDTNWILLYYIIKNKEVDFRRIQQSANIPSVSKKQVEELCVQLPMPMEQIRIGSFFKNLDDLIVKTEQRINKLKNIKKACLDKMFVNE